MAAASDRPSGRAPNAMRPIQFERGFTCHAEGSVLVSFGQTKVICTASVTAGVPRFLRGKGEGWLTAEYGNMILWMILTKWIVISHVVDDGCRLPEFVVGKTTF